MKASLLLKIEEGKWEKPPLEVLLTVITFIVSILNIDYNL